MGGVGGRPLSRPLQTVNTRIFNNIYVQYGDVNQNGFDL